MAKDKGWGSKTSSDNNYYKLLKDSVVDYPCDEA